MRRTTTALRCAMLGLVLVGCTGGPSGDGTSRGTPGASGTAPSAPGVAVPGVAVPGTAGPHPAAPGAASTAPVPAGTASPGADPARTMLMWADGTPVTGTTLDLGAARRVRLGEDLTHVRDVPVEPGTRTTVLDLRPDGTFLMVMGDVEPSGDGSGSIRALREVTAAGVRTLRSPHDADAAERLPTWAARRVDGGVAWVEPYGDGESARLVRAPAGSQQGQVVLARSAAGSDVVALAAWGAVLADGRVVAWDGAVSGEPAPPGTLLRYATAGDDVVESRCGVATCEIALVTAGGARDVVLRGPRGTWVTDADAGHLLVRFERDDGSLVHWGVDLAARGAVRIIGDDVYGPMSEGRIVVTDARGVVVVDLVSGVVERLVVGDVWPEVAVAGDLVTIVTGVLEGAGASAELLRWPRPTLSPRPTPSPRPAR